MMLNSVELRDPATVGDGDRRPPSVIETRKLTKTYPGGTVAVVGLDLEVLHGEIFGLLGPNGAAKTTTIGMLTTRVTPSGGAARVGGVDIVHHPALAKQVIGVVPQTNTLDRAMTVYENLFFHGRYFGMSSKRARDSANTLLEKVRLADRASTPVVALSGGMAQRLMVAPSIMHRPQILFLDEPTAGLDPQSRLALDTPAALKRGVGADSVVRVSADGDLARLADHLRATLPGTTEARVVDGTVRVLASGRGLLPHIVSAAEHIGIDVTDLSVSEPSLETVFLDLTGKELRE